MIEVSLSSINNIAKNVFALGHETHNNSLPASGNISRPLITFANSSNSEEALFKIKTDDTHIMN